MQLLIVDIVLIVKLECQAPSLSLSRTVLQNHQSQGLCAARTGKTYRPTECCWKFPCRISKRMLTSRSSMSPCQPRRGYMKPDSQPSRLFHQETLLRTPTPFYV